MLDRQVPLLCQRGTEVWIEQTNRAHALVARDGDGWARLRHLGIGKDIAKVSGGGWRGGLELRRCEREVRRHLLVNASAFRVFGNRIAEPNDRLVVQCRWGPGQS